MSNNSKIILTIDLTFLNKELTRKLGAGINITQLQGLRNEIKLISERLLVLQEEMKG